MTDQLTNSDITRLVQQIGLKPGRVRLPGPPVVRNTVASVEDITPLDAMTLIAGAWERYQNGRNFYPTKLDKIIRYAHAMTDGTWEYRPDGDPIHITDGMVTGGRHRLHAILLSNTTQRCNVQRHTTKETL